MVGGRETRSPSLSTASSSSGQDDCSETDAEIDDAPAKRRRLSVPRCVVAMVDRCAPLADAVEVRVRISNGLTVTVLEASREHQDWLVEEAVKAPTGARETDPYGAALWPSGQVLAQAVAAHAAVVEQPTQRVLELGSGCGLASLTAAALGLQVLATDFRGLPLEFLNEAARRQGFGALVTTQIFDVCDNSVPLPSAALVIASDILYDRQTAEAVAARVAEARRRGSSVLIGDVGRPNRDFFLAELQRLLPDHDCRFDVHGMAVQASRGRGTAHPSRQVPVDILEIPSPGPAARFVKPDRPSIAVRPVDVGPYSLLESTCWA